MTTVLVTGGAGYIGSHTCLELLATGHDVVVVDNLCNANPEALRRVQTLAGRALAGVYHFDIADRSMLRDVFARHDIDAVVHFAALKAVGESVAQPLLYYRNNVSGTIVLLEVMAQAGVRQLVFSSSATVYGEPARLPLTEQAAILPSNPYGWSKAMSERVLLDAAAADPAWRVVILRYFNPVGAHESGCIGEDPRGMPNNLMPFVSQVAVGVRDYVRIFGDDYATPDGTGVRDYIHVVDLALAHVRALEQIGQLPPTVCLNLGTGRGYSVLEVINAYSLACGKPIPYRVVERREGDVAACWADPSLAARLLGWRAIRDLPAMCEDSWRWQSSNPDGYGG